MEAVAGSALTRRQISNPPTVASPAFKVPRTLADNYALDTGSAVGLPDPNLRTPYVYNWSLGVQREISKVVVEVNYIGSAGHHLFNSVNLNRYAGDLA